MIRSSRNRRSCGNESRRGPSPSCLTIVCASTFCTGGVSSAPFCGRGDASSSMFRCYFWLLDRPTGRWGSVPSVALAMWPGGAARDAAAADTCQQSMLKLGGVWVDGFPMSARASVGPRAALKPAAWIDKWLAAVHDLAELERSNPMSDAVIEEIDGRMIRVGDRWLADFASCNYLGFDLERKIMDAIPRFVE